MARVARFGRWGQGQGRAWAGCNPAIIAPLGVIPHVFRLLRSVPGGFMRPFKGQADPREAPLRGLKTTILGHMRGILASAMAAADGAVGERQHRCPSTPHLTPFAPRTDLGHWRMPLRRPTWRMASDNAISNGRSQRRTAEAKTHDTMTKQQKPKPTILGRES